MPLPPGTRLGAYEIEVLVGAGRMGKVYRARDTRLDRTVAIKFLSMDGGPQPERFEREARVLSRLGHPRICSLYDVGDKDGAPYLVMEYVEGQTLSARMKEGPLSLEEALQYGFQIAEALDGAHRQRVFHRDLKPGNVVVTKTGVKLLDFGFAKLTRPERDGGGEERRRADAHSDFFALGSMLDEMLRGGKAPEGSRSASLDRALRRCLTKDPDERWRSARDLAAELYWILAGVRTTDARSPGPMRWARNRWLMAGVVGVALGAALVLGLYVVEGLR